MYSQANAALIAADGWHMDKGGPLQMHWSAVDRMMDAARAEGEEAGTIKAEHNADDHIAMLESRLLAAIWAIPNDHRVGALQKEATRIQGERQSMKVQLEAAEMELGHAIDRAKRAEAEAERFEALQAALDSWAVSAGRVVFRTDHGDMYFPRKPTEPLTFTPPETDADAEKRRASRRASQADAVTARWKESLEPHITQSEQRAAMHQVIDGLRKLVAAP